MSAEPVLIDGEWKASHSDKCFQATNPATGVSIEESYPISDWVEIEACVDAAWKAYESMRAIPALDRASFLDAFADRIEARKDEICAMANKETALPISPRLADGELPRTTNQLRQAAESVRDRSWMRPVIDSKANIRACLGPIGPVVVFGPNNFPLAFNGISGGDFASAIAAGNPVIAKANSSHPGTTQLLAEEALAAAVESGMPPAIVQLLYRTSHLDGARLVSHPKVAATGYTGSRKAGLVLKQAADQAGKPIYLELSSVNPVVILPGAMRERSEQLAEEFQASCLMGTGQFCTNPGIVFLAASDETEQFISAVARRFEQAPVGTLLSKGVQENLAAAVDTLTRSGAELVTGGGINEEAKISYKNSLARVSGSVFLDNPAALQEEAFGNFSLFVVVQNVNELVECLWTLEGNLTGCIYSHTGDEDESDYQAVAAVLRQKVGRLLNDKMPTGVAVSSAMNHGGPYPATGHPGFTAVGIPASIERFTALQCYDNVRTHRLPAILRDQNLTNTPWRYIDGQWTRSDVQ